MTRNRFVKLIMSMGASRNAAAKYAVTVANTPGKSYDGELTSLIVEVSKIICSFAEEMQTSIETVAIHVQAMSDIVLKALGKIGTGQTICGLTDEEENG